MTGRELNDAIARRAAKGWGEEKRSYWLIGADRRVTAATASTPGAVTGYGVFDGQVIGEDELANARASGRIRPIS